MVYSLINDDVDVRPLLSIFKACHLFVFDLFIFVIKGIGKSLKLTMLINCYSFIKQVVMWKNQND